MQKYQPYVYIFEMERFNKSSLFNSNIFHTISDNNFCQWDLATSPTAYLHKFNHSPTIQQVITSLSVGNKGFLSEYEITTAFTSVFTKLEFIAVTAYQNQLVFSFFLKISLKALEGIFNSILLINVMRILDEEA